MALIDCPDCGREVSSSASVCPDCAYPIGSGSPPVQAHEMRIVAFIIQPRVIDRILTHLHRIATEPRRSRAPPRRWTSPHTTTSA